MAGRGPPSPREAKSRHQPTTRQVSYKDPFSIRPSRLGTQSKIVPLRMRLPFEILLVVMEASSQRTVAKMTRTCHALRDGGARILLDGGVSLSTEEHIRSFFQFLRANPASRIQHIRDLNIAVGELPRRMADELLWLITSPLLALDSLALRKAGSLLKSNVSPSELIPDASGDPGVLVTALVQLKTVRHLKIGQCDQRACMLVRTICSPLKTISMDFPADGPRNGDEAESRNPILLLAKHSATLEEISGTHFAMLKPEILYDTVFPSVRKLSATYDGVWSHRTRAHIRAFPNVTRLRLGFADRAHIAVLLHSFLAERAMRRRSWNRRSLEGENPPPTWKELKELHGTVTDVLALGIASHVPMLRLIGTVRHKSVEYEHIPIILEDTRPAGLAIAVAGASTFGDMMGALLSGRFAQQIRALNVELVFSASEGDADIHTVLNNVAATLALLPLHYASLTLNYGLLTAPEESYRPKYGWFCPLERDVEGLDPAATQAIFRAAIPSLRRDIVVRLSTDRKSGKSMLGVVGEPDRCWEG